MGNNIKVWDEFLKENASSKNIELWNEYLKLVDIIDGIISEHGELSNSYWKPGLVDELDSISSSVSTIKDISDNRNRIVDNFKALMDGLIGWSGAGHNISRYGTLSNINASLFN